jgi:hypothetical protein
MESIGIIILALMLVVIGYIVYAAIWLVLIVICVALIFNLVRMLRKGK